MSKTFIGAQVAQARAKKPDAKQAAKPAQLGDPRQHGLSLYLEPPVGEVTIEEFERFALDRLKVLKGIDEAKVRGKHGRELHEVIKQLLVKHMQMNERSERLDEWHDTVSHFVLRLAYCRTEELRRWFLAQECELFRTKFSAVATMKTQAAFLEECALPYEAMSLEQYRQHYEALLAVHHSRHDRAAAERLGACHPETAPGKAAEGASYYFQVPFEQVPDLVGQRRVLLVRGTAFVSRDELTSLVVQHFRAHLSKALVVTGRKWAAQLAGSERERLTPMVEALSQRYLGPDYGNVDDAARDVLLAKDIPALAAAGSFPLCMLNLYNHAHSDHHLRHFGRLQLGLFLKGIGLPLEEALRFWRTEFAPRAPGDKFEKEYAYNIRHGYGKEGKKANYTPWGCTKIVPMTPGVGEFHGCPYKTWDTAALRSALGQLGVPGAKVDEAVSHARGGHYQLACAATWEGVHKCECVTGINHPNQYFDESRKVFKERAGGDDKAAGGSSGQGQQEQQAAASAKKRPAEEAAADAGAGEATPMES